MHFRKAFTLIELIIVLAIIGVLIVALLPVVTGAPGRARDAQRKVALNNIAAALESFSSDYGRLPGGATARYCLGNSGATPPVSNGISSADFSALASYLKGGVPTDPSTRGTRCGLTAGYYLYHHNIGIYLVGAYVENFSQANACLDVNNDDIKFTSSAEADALISSTPVTASSCTGSNLPFYIVIGG